MSTDVQAAQAAYEKLRDELVDAAVDLENAHRDATTADDDAFIAAINASLAAEDALDLWVGTLLSRVVDMEKRLARHD